MCDSTVNVHYCWKLYHFYVIITSSWKIYRWIHKHHHHNYMLFCSVARPKHHHHLQSFLFQTWGFLHMIPPHCISPKRCNLSLCSFHYSIKIHCYQSICPTNLISLSPLCKLHKFSFSNFHHLLFLILCTHLIPSVCLQKCISISAMLSLSLRCV